MSVPILLIDDDKKLGDLLRKYMEGHGYTLSIATNAHEGLRQLRAQEFEAVLLDIMLPDGDGLEVCKKIRAESPIPILMLT
ncbi:MAG TPA: response regulator, partial [Acidobacteriota bacterium]